MLCDYGCGAEGLFTMSTGRYCCSKRYNSCIAVRKRASVGLEKAHSDGKITFPEGYVPHNKGKHRPELMKADFSLNGKGNHKAILIYERGHKCESCANTEWLSDPIPLELEHIDGNNKNNTKENLKLLCCNCHALTPTWRGRNAKRETNHKVTNENLIIALRDSYNIREALIKVGLVGKGGNYTRCKKILESGIKLKQREIQLDKNNSQYGKMWICHLDNKENKKINPSELPIYIDMGWEKGRVSKFGQVAQLVETR